VNLSSLEQASAKVAHEPRTPEAADVRQPEAAAQGDKPKIVIMPPVMRNPVPFVSHEKREMGPEDAPMTDGGLSGDALEPSGIHVKVAEGHTAAEHEHVHSYVGLMFFFTTLMIGCGILLVHERVLNKLPLVVPYTAWLFVAGMFMSLVHELRIDDFMNGVPATGWGTLYTSIGMWSSINPHMLMYAFLPALLFGEAVQLNVQLVTKCFWQVFILACPGVLLGTALTGCMAKYLLPYDWSWPFALVFGVIMSATDPVAVVALLKTLGVSKRLTMLVSGESILNDGTAIVIFQLMLKVVLGASLTTSGVAQFVGVVVGGAVVFGAIWGVFCLGVIMICSEDAAESDAMIQVISTVYCGYLGFFLAESEFGCSGVLTVVSSGFVLAMTAWPNFVNKETMHVVWEAIEFVGNTVIFFLAGTIFMGACMKRSEYIGWRDVCILFLLWIGLTLIRAIMIFTCRPFMNLVGDTVKYTECIVMVWGGLRGAVGLALAIIVDSEPGIDARLRCKPAWCLVFPEARGPPSWREEGVQDHQGAKWKMCAILIFVIMFTKLGLRSEVHLTHCGPISARLRFSKCHHKCVL
jgi:NhaP-type Na+/H+ or K+/H+ antiporter